MTASRWQRERRIELLSCYLRAGLSEQEIEFYATELQDIPIEALKTGAAVIISDWQPVCRGDFPSVEEIREACGEGYSPGYTITGKTARSRLDKFLSWVLHRVGVRYDSF